MPEVCKIINSNLPLYEELLHSRSSNLDYFVDELWAQSNFSRREFYLAKNGEFYVGAASFQILADFGYIGYFHIHRDYHRQGFGNSLLNFLKLRCKTVNLEKIRLFTHKNATWAQNFYKSKGFNLIETDREKIRSMDLGALKPYHAVNHILWEYNFNSK